MPLRHVEERVAEHLYNMSIPDQVEILKHNFGIKVEDTDEGVVFGGVLILDSHFDSILIDIIESMDTYEILDLWSEIVNCSCEFDEEGNVVWEEVSK